MCHRLLLFVIPLRLICLFSTYVIPIIRMWDILLCVAQRMANGKYRCFWANGKIFRKNIKKSNSAQKTVDAVHSNSSSRSSISSSQYQFQTKLILSSSNRFMVFSVFHLKSNNNENTFQSNMSFLFAPICLDWMHVIRRNSSYKMASEAGIPLKLTWNKFRFDFSPSSSSF